MSASFENAHISHRRLTSRKLFAKTSRNTEYSERLLFVCLWLFVLFCFVIGWFLILERTAAFLFWIYLSFQERTKLFPATITLKSGKVKVLEYLRKLGRGLISFSSNTSFELMNQWMIVTSRPWRVMKRSFEINANLWLWILQIVETDPDSS